MKLWNAHDGHQRQLQPPWSMIGSMPGSAAQARAGSGERQTLSAFQIAPETQLGYCMWGFPSRRKWVKDNHRLARKTGHYQSL